MIHICYIATYILANCKYLTVGGRPMIRHTYIRSEALHLAELQAFDSGGRHIAQQDGITLHIGTDIKMGP